MIGPAELEDIRLDLEAAEQERKAAVTALSTLASFPVDEAVAIAICDAPTATDTFRGINDNSGGLIE